MAEQNKPPTAAELSKLLPPDPRREAVNAQRGLDWQRWLTVARWLELSGEDALFIEWGEDFTTIGQGEARSVPRERISALGFSGRIDAFQANRVLRTHTPKMYDVSHLRFPFEVKSSRRVRGH